MGLGRRYAEPRPFSLLLVAMSGVGVLFPGWLTYLELFVIHAICMWCVVSAVIVALIFIASLFDLRELAGDDGGAQSLDASVPVQRA